MPPGALNEPSLSKVAGAVLLHSSQVRVKDSEFERAAVDIASTPPSGSEIGFLPAAFCQVALPRSKPTAATFSRKQGGVEMHMYGQAVEPACAHNTLPIPYGPLARAILIYVTTQAVQHDTLCVKLGKSASGFLDVLGRASNGGDRGSYRSLYLQLNAFMTCHFRITYLDQTFEGCLFKQETKNEPAPTRRWLTELTLHEEFAEILRASCVPIDQRAVRALSSSSFGLDVYLWLTHRLRRVAKEQFVPWRCLVEQFGQEFTGKRAMNDFKKRFKEALRDALLMYPKATVLERPGGLLLLKSPPPVPCG